MSDPITIIIPVVVNKKFQLFWSEDTVIELYDDFVIVKDNYIREVYVDNEDHSMGMKECIVNYETLVRKQMISEVEWTFNRAEDSYYFNINMISGSIPFATKTKKEAIDNYNILKNWLFK